MFIVIFPDPLVIDSISLMYKISNEFLRIGVNCISPSCSLGEALTIKYTKQLSV